MKNFNIKGLTPQSVGGVFILFLALVNAILQIFGYQPVQIGNDEIYEIIKFPKDHTNNEKYIEYICKENNHVITIYKDHLNGNYKINNQEISCNNILEA